MRRVLILAVVSVCLSGRAFVVPCVAADSAAGKTAAKVLLEKGWDKSTAGRALAEHSRLDEPPLSGDSQVLAARWLVLMYHSRYDDALAQLEKFLKTSPADELKLAALRAKAWILTVKKDYQKAMVVADQIVQAATPNPPLTEPRILDAQSDSIAFVGRLAGFIEGPGEKSADQNVRAKLEERVLNRIDEGRKKTFNEAKAAVLEEFQDLVGDAAEAKVDSKTAAELAKEEQLRKLSTENEKLSSEAGKIEGQTKKVAEDLQKKLDDLRKMDAPLVQQFLLLQGQLTALNTQLDQQRSLVRQLSTPNNTKGGSSTNVNSLALNRAQDAVANLQGQINLKSNQMAMIQQKHNEIEQMMIAAGGSAQMQGMKLENMRQGLDRDRLKNENRQKKTEKKKASGSSKALALEAEAKAFTTYDDFPLEDVRSRLLEIFQ